MAFDIISAAANVTKTSTAVVTAAAQSTATLQTRYQWLFNQIGQASGIGQASTQAVIPSTDYTALRNLLVATGYAVTKTDVTAQHILPDSTAQSPDFESVTQSLVTITWAVIDGVSVTPVAQPIVTASTQTAPLTGLNLTSFTATQGTLLVARFIPQGGQAPYWFTTDGNTPEGLAWSTKSRVSTLTLQGTPTTPAQEYATLTITVVDSTGQTASQDISWTISPSAKNASVLI
jgi:hypothetical protein